jgi:hypothetical protein
MTVQGKSPRQGDWSGWNQRVTGLVCRRSSSSLGLRHHDRPGCEISHIKFNPLLTETIHNKHTSTNTPFQVRHLTLPISMGSLTTRTCKIPALHDSPVSLPSYTILLTVRIQQVCTGFYTGHSGFLSLHRCTAKLCFYYSHTIINHIL